MSMTDEEWAAIEWTMEPAVVVVPKNPQFESWYFSGCTWTDNDGLLNIFKGVSNEMVGSFRVEELLGWYNTSVEVPDDLNNRIRESRF